MITATDESRRVRDSGLFDAAWYGARYPDVAGTGLDPVDHYLRVGVRLGRDPSAKFSTSWYLESNPDVARSGANPLVHYLNFGKDEGRLPKPGAPAVAIRQPVPAPTQPVAEGRSQRVVDMHGTPVELTPAPCFGPNGYEVNAELSGPGLFLPHGPTARGGWPTPEIGIHVHLHYADLATEFAELLANLRTPFALYVSVTDPEATAAVAATFRGALPQARVEVRSFRNRGRDIGPFFAGFGRQLAKHELVAHFHSKRSPHNRNKADWRRQLLHGLLGSEATVQTLLRLFAGNPHLGMVFPEYHWSLRGQISWGDNFDVCRRLANSMGMEVDKDRLALFPAGSMFWARGAALKPLFDLDLSFDDFPDELAQVDGTLAHGVERLFGEVVVHSGLDLLQVKPDKPYNLVHYHPKKWPYPEVRAKAAVEAVTRRAASPTAGRNDGRRIVVFTAIAGGYDRLLPHERLEDGVDYVAFSDVPIPDAGLWQVRPMDYWHPDAVRMARYVKAHPHKYFPEHDVAIWVDANVVIRGELGPYLRRLHDGGQPIAGIPHPLRDCLYAESDVIVKAGIDKSGRVERQMQAYRELGFPARHGLIETNFLLTDLRHPGSRKAMDGWWEQMEKYSHRDQLSLNFVLWANRFGWTPVMDEKVSLRDNADFAYLGHGNNSGYPLPVLDGVGLVRDPYAELAHAARAPAAAACGAVDIVVCVHNALDEVADCLASVRRSIRPGDRIVIVDDASGDETARFLDSYAVDCPEATLIRNPAPALGYCAAANIGMRAVRGEVFLLLNSDTVLTPTALGKLVALIESDPALGIVGPMSNAASTQSVPDTRATERQTAINGLPEGLAVEDMDRLCEAWSLRRVFPSVPLVHGFCQMIRRSVIETVGGFDEEAFPNGYGEENDLCFRAANAGFDLKIATDAYVFHVKSASYSDDERRRTLMRQGSEKLRQKHGADRLARAIGIMEGHPLLVRMREQARVLYTQTPAKE